MDRITEKNKPLTQPRRDRVSIGVLLGLLLLLTVQFLLQGPFIAPDTPKLVAFSTRVSPLYPWYLTFWRALLGTEGAAFFAAALFQNLLLGWCIFSLCEYLRRALPLSPALFVLTSLTAALTFLVQRFFTDSGCVISNSIMSEGLAYPLFFLYIKYALDSFLHRNRRSCLRAAVCSFLLMATRGQLIWTPLPLLPLGWYCLLPAAGKRRFAGLITPPALLALLLLLSSLFSGLTNLNRHGFYSQNTQGRSVLLATALWCSQPEDAALFPEDSAEHAVFVEMNAHIDEYQCAARCAPEGLYRRFDFFTHRYDRLKDIISTVVGQNAGGEDIGTIYMRLTLKLLPAHPSALFRQCGMNFLAGLVRSAALFRPGITELTLLGYAAALCFLVFCRAEALRALRCFLLLVLLCTFINALVVSFGVFALSRYVFYNLPPLYIAAEAVFAALVKQLRRSNK